MWKCEDGNSIVRFQSFSMEMIIDPQGEHVFSLSNFWELDYAWSVEEIFESVHENDSSIFFHFWKNEFLFL